ncbi:MAG: DEAD/DEAH box helicase [Chloroflexota bacterium]|nr:DEAD/DEAH box helicase [Dehalococcoidia bacterium]MDW8253359.1 DEAD/DEAH box helicase [Chloroflexota bacterium]
MTPAEFIERLRRDPAFSRQIVHVAVLPPRPARYEALERPLPPSLASRLRQRGIERFWSHQAEAINAARRGEHVVIATSTASGKSLCYHLPTLEALEADQSARALYLFPTKALAQDQLRSLATLAPTVEARTFDGDTPPAERQAARARAQILLTNPDMLQVGILPRHHAWSAWLRRLRFVVIDEAHVYRGVFGSHVANVLRRLRRLCAFYGSAPLFIATSATIGNPGEHFRRLVGETATVVTEDGSPHGSKYFLFWNPALLDGAASARRSANTDAAALLVALVRAKLRTIVFTKTRKLAELIARYARDRLEEELRDRVASYRAGYLPAVRREIEGRLFRGELLGVIATNALELGIDIGDLAVTVLTGYPGSIASVWQQAGRSGRGREESLAILIALDNPLDQYLVRHPELIFGTPLEHARINPANPKILYQHVLAAAYERPIDLDDLTYFGEELLGAVHDLAESGLLQRRNDRWHLTPRAEYPAGEIDIRSASGRPVALVASGRTIETIEAETAAYHVHPGAVYLHQGETYLVEDLDLTARVARARPADVPYYTAADEQTELTIRATIDERAAGRTVAALGQVDVRTRVIGYTRRRVFSEEILSRERLDLPPYTFETVAVWWTVPEAARREVERAGRDFAGGLHAAEHACIGLLPLFALCDRRDLGGISTPCHPDTGQPTIVIYDGHAGGVGIAERGYHELEALWSAAAQLLRDCPCEDGCPSCIQSPKCGNNNDLLDKAAARILLEWLSFCGS